MANDKMYEANVLPSKNCCQQQSNHQSPTSAATSYTICGENGSHILMDTESMYTATKMQFVTPQRTKDALWNDIALLPKHLLDGQILRQTTTAFVEQQTSLQTPFCQQFAYITKLNATGQSSPKHIYEEKSTFTSPQSNESDINSKFYDEDHKMFQESSGDETSIVKTIKNALSSWVRQFIDKTTEIAATDNANTSSSARMEAIQSQWTQTRGSPSHNNHKTQPMHCDNSGSNRFLYSSEQSDIFMNLTPETYLDCDDYIDGGEDTIDFVADSTKIQWNSFGDELSYSSPNDTIFYDCFNKSESDLATSELKLEQDPQPQQEPELIIEDSVEQITSNVVDRKSDGKIENVQHEEEESTENCLKYVQANRNSYRRKRRRRQKHKVGNKHRQKGKGARKKNQHEKLRHEVEMNIHDDIDDCFIINEDDVTCYYDPDDEDDPNIDLDIIDMLEQKLNCSISLTATAGSSTDAMIDNNVVIVEAPILSPEIVPSARIFTNFFRLDNTCKQKLLPFRCAEKRLPPVMSSKDESISWRRTSETESDDSFIIFDNKCQRPKSECSDDFILFAEEDVDLSDDDYTDSTDSTESTDSDDSDDGKLLF